MALKKKKQIKKPDKSPHGKPIIGRVYLEENLPWHYNRFSEYIILFIMAISVFLLYSNTLHYPFHFDDEYIIVENTDLHIKEISWDLITKMINRVFGFRPIPMASFALNYYFGGHYAFGYHLVNILIHIVNGVLIYFFLKFTLLIQVKNNQFKTIGIKENANNNPLTYNHDIFWIVFFSALLWLVHPLQTNSVTYIVQRMNSMAALFFLSSILLYIQGRNIQIKNLSDQPTRAKKSKSASYLPYFFYTGSLTAGFISLGCKETSATLPFFVLLYELFFFQNLRSESIKKLLLFSLIVIVSILLIFLAAIGFQFLSYYFDLYYAGYNFTMSQRVLTEFRVIIYYLSLIFFPHPNRMNFDYDFPLSHSLIDPVTTVFSLSFIIILLAVAFFFAKKEKILSFAILWFFGNLVIESSIIPLDIIFEHRTYLPSILISLIFVIAIWRLIKYDKLKIFILSGFVVLLSFWTLQRNSVWENSISLWQDCVKKSPNKDRPHADLGRSYELAGRLDEAIEEFEKTLKINPLHQFALRNMGLAMYKKGNLDESISFYRKALQSDPYLAEAHNDLGVALIDKKKLEEGISHYQQAIQLKPTHPEAHANLEKAMRGLSQINNLIAETLKKSKDDPINPEHYQQLGFLHYRKGNFDAGMEYYQKALSLDSTNSKSLKGIAAIHVEKKEYESAVSIFKKILEFQPDNSEIYYNIACVYSLQNQKENAISWLQKAVDKGFQKSELITKDRDLQNIRETEGYKKITH
jgi:protein O-mannosyl-transferase